MAYYYAVPKYRFISARTGCPDITQVLFAANGETTELEAAIGRAVDEQKEAWARQFRDVGSKMERFLDGLAKTDDFYTQPIGQVKATGKGALSLWTHTIKDMEVFDAFVGPSRLPTCS